MSAVILWHLMVIILSSPLLLEAAAALLPALQLLLRAALGVLHGLPTEEEVMDGMEAMLFAVLVAELLISPFVWCPMSAIAMRANY